MQTLLQYVAPPSPCGYLPDETWQLEYEMVRALSSAEYLGRLQHGWRRFGHSLFRPKCPSCRACQSLRVVVDDFRPDRSQRRVRKLNEGSVTLHIGQPTVTPERLRLYDRFHEFQSDTKGWPEHPPKDAEEYALSFVHNPFPTQEWCYYLDDRLVGLGFVDVLAEGLSAIYFIHDPDLKARSLGTWNVLSILEYAARERFAHVYLGYFVEGSRSMVYKARFVPNQVLDSGGVWRGFRR